ncbi:hypothetical protein CALVIDRAFT_373195 [Calocera viscosa TUFC12733]|uniref:Protein kinase domain-containing protein n=1 Tax=Calocera viscosa (strain TUFC12733) TaxID=1330018 RepID=A0A167GTW2_CALVF|nr:hypothetical protein CALVIDRAFT_373195 [Calocera viscosa TUFC12733]
MSFMSTLMLKLLVNISHLLHKGREILMVYKAPPNDGGPRHRRDRARDRNLRPTYNKAPPPSTGAKCENLSKFQGLYPIQNGRPLEHLGRHLGIYVKAFDHFKQFENEPLTPPSKDDALSLRELFTEINRYFADESARRSAVQPILDKLLNTPVLEIVNTDGSRGDGSYVAEALGRPGGAETTFFEWKGELNSGGSEPVQRVASLARKAWRQDKRKELRDLCCCPAFTIVIQGTHLKIQGIAFVPSPHTEELATLSLESNHHPLEDYIRRVYRALVRLRESIRMLEEYYKKLNRQEPLRCFPRHRSIKRQVGGAQEIVYEDILLPSVHSKTLFSATVDGQDCVVKFPFTYCVEAHRLLADKQLAPKLIACQLVEPGRYYCVVMEHLPGQTLDEIDGPYPQQVVDGLHKVLDTLKEHGFVHGDLRTPNIMYASETGQLKVLDFDWAGRDGEVRYPLMMNCDAGISWHPNATPGALILREHDQHLVQLLLKK